MQGARCPPSAATLQKAIHEACIPGLAAIVVSPTGILYEQAVGYQSPEHSSARRAMHPAQSIFVLASISKTFIAVAVMQLVESKRLDLDVDVNRYLSPDVLIRHPLHPDVAITLRHVLSHSAGIGFNLHENLAHSKPGDEFIHYTLAGTILKYLSKSSNWLPEAPGTSTMYSNVGTCIAALVVERVANKPFERYIRDAILTPLGIGENEAGYRLSDFDGRRDDLVGHYVHDASWLETLRALFPHLNITQANDESNWLAVSHFGAVDYPAGFLRMSARSLAVYLQSFLNGFPSLLQHQSSVDEMLRVVRPDDAETMKFGLLWYWQMFNDRRLVGHRGAVLGVSHILAANEKRTLGVIVLSNGDETKNDAHAKKVYETVVHIVNELFDCFENAEVLLETSTVTE